MEGKQQDQRYSQSDSFIRGVVIYMCNINSSLGATLEDFWVHITTS